MWGGFAAGSLRANAVALGCLLALPAAAERVQSLAPTQPAPGNERRVALVIGNGAYKSSPLRNPVNDARAVGRALADVGFAVMVLEDGTRAGMHRAVRLFGDELLRGGAGLFYYAGHGMQVRGRNYLVPVDVEIEREDEVEFQAVDANLVLAKMDSAKNSLNLMILDACRNNPFARSFRSATQGLAQMDAPSGTLVAFATAPGSVAADGDGENGVYTKHLLKELRQPGLPVEQLFKRVRVGVSIETGDRQIPWESSSLKGDFFFTPEDARKASRVQKAVIDQAVSEAVRQSERRAAKDRAAVQAEMRKMMQELLAAQRAQLETELKSRGQPAPAAKAPAKAPVQVASAAPSEATAVESRRPKRGDRWTYIGWTTRTPDKKGKTRFEIRGVTDDGILEALTTWNGRKSEWVHGPGIYFVGRDSAMPFFSPYFRAFGGEFKDGERWRNLPFQHFGVCSSNPGQRCNFTAKVLGRETVTVPAGTFDAWRVEVELVAVPVGGGAWSRSYTYWFADAAKRFVKHTDRGNSPNSTDVEIVLESYKLN